MTLKTSNNSNNLLFLSNQKYLNLFVFFSIFPLIKIAGISITFYIFLIICYSFFKFNIKIFKIEGYTDILLLLFLSVLIISSIFSEDTYTNRSISSIFKLTVQYVYWVVLALFIKTWITYFNYYEISKYFFFASIISIVYYIFFNSFYFLFRPNEFAFTIVLALPLSFHYMKDRFNIYQMLFLFIFFMFGLFLSESRTGTALVLFEFILLVVLFSKNIKNITFILSLLFLPLFFTIFSLLNFDKEEIKKIKYSLATQIEDISPKFAYTLRMNENISERDKSLLIRKLMIQKGERIFEKHPLLGIGIGNFSQYYVQLDIITVSHWLKRSNTRYNRVSSQNSYLKILTETGIFAFIFIFSIFIIIILYGLKHIFIFKEPIKVFIFISFFTLIIYGFILVTIQGAKFWLLLGLSLSLLYSKKTIS